MMNERIPERAKRPEKLEVEPGDRFVICRCLQSSNMPFCDGTHRQGGCEIKPIIVEGKSA